MSTFRSLLFISAALVSLQGWAQQKPKTPAKSAPHKYGCTSVMESPRMTTFDTAKARGLVDPYYLWENGSVLKVRILTGSPAMKEMVKMYAKEWEKYANIKFDFVDYGPATIRVNLDDKGGHNSVIGTIAASIPDDVKTMNLDTTDFQTAESMHGTVMHEFGHAIGLLHEHYSPKAGIPWNKEAVYKELEKTQGWDKVKVDVNLFAQYSLTYTHGTSYDRYSIMHYPVFARWTTNGYSVGWNNVVSAGDIALVGALYPKVGNREGEVPRFIITNYTKMVVVNSAAKGGLLLYPSFKIKTAGAEGQVYFSVLFYDENGDPIMDNNDKYNISNVVATYKGFKFLPGKTLSANINSANDFELFLPYSEFPVAAGTKVQAIFKAFLIDGEEFKLLYSSNPVGLSVIK